MAGREREWRLSTRSEPALVSLEEEIGLLPGGQSSATERVAATAAVCWKAEATALGRAHRALRQQRPHGQPAARRAQPQPRPPPAGLEGVVEVCGACRLLRQELAQCSRAAQKAKAECAVLAARLGIAEELLGRAAPEAAAAEALRRSLDAEQDRAAGLEEAVCGFRQLAVDLQSGLAAQTRDFEHLAAGLQQMLAHAKPSKGAGKGFGKSPLYQAQSSSDALLWAVRRQLRTSAEKSRIEDERLEELQAARKRIAELESARGQAEEERRGSLQSEARLKASSTQLQRSYETELGQLREELSSLRGLPATGRLGSRGSAASNWRPVDRTSSPAASTAATGRPTRDMEGVGRRTSREAAAALAGGAGGRRHEEEDTRRLSALDAESPLMRGAVLHKLCLRNGRWQQRFARVLRPGAAARLKWSSDLRGQSLGSRSKGVLLDEVMRVGFGAGELPEKVRLPGSQPWCCFGLWTIGRAFIFWTQEERVAEVFIAGLSYLCPKAPVVRCGAVRLQRALGKLGKDPHARASAVLTGLREAAARRPQPVDAGGQGDEDGSLADAGGQRQEDGSGAQRQEEIQGSAPAGEAAAATGPGSASCLPTMPAGSGAGAHQPQQPPRPSHHTLGALTSGATAAPGKILVDLFAAAGEGGGGDFDGEQLSFGRRPSASTALPGSGGGALPFPELLASTPGSSLRA